MVRNTRLFSDLDLNFTKHPVTGDISRRYDENAVKASLKNLILTSNYERPFHSELGSQVRALLFEPATPMTRALLERSIEDLISNYEPRVQLIEVQANISDDNNAVYVRVEFKIVNTERPLTLDIALERTR
jgi:phage baseplate assembly protein W